MTAVLSVRAYLNEFSHYKKLIKNTDKKYCTQVADGSIKIYLSPKTHNLHFNAHCHLLKIIKIQWSSYIKGQIMAEWEHELFSIIQYTSNVVF